MYSMEDLLELTSNERADSLEIDPGKPPVLVVGGEQNAIEGPPLSAEDTDLLLRTIANSRQMRELHERRFIRFMYTLRPRSSFLVHARLEDEQIKFEIRQS